MSQKVEEKHQCQYCGEILIAVPAAHNKMACQHCGRPVECKVCGFPFDFPASGTLEDGAWLKTCRCIELASQQQPNAKCRCGSGKKFKRCHGRVTACSQ